MSKRLMAALLGVAAIAGIAVLVMTRQAASAAAPVSGVTLPERKIETPAEVPPVPRVPEAAERLQPLAYTLDTAWVGTSASTPVSRQRVTRSRTRVHLLLDGGRREWYFERNPVAPDRVTGYLVDHDAREIRVHDDSDLRNRVQIRGWADVVLMRFDAEALASLRATGERRQHDGLAVEHYVAADAASRGVVDAWWSPDALLALDWTTRESADRAVRARVTGLTHAVDETLLTDPAMRFPNYKVLDAADAGDEQH